MSGIDKVLEKIKAKKILVVEDDNSIREIISELMSREGYDCLTASDGKEAIDLYNKSPEVHLVLTDLSMPRMNGVELVNKIREDDEKVPIIVFSGFIDRRAMIKMIDNKISSCFYKPFNFLELKKQATDLLEGTTVQ